MLLPEILCSIHERGGLLILRGGKLIHDGPELTADLREAIRTNKEVLMIALSNQQGYLVVYRHAKLTHFMG